VTSASRRPSRPSPATAISTSTTSRTRADAQRARIPPRQRVPTRRGQALAAAEADARPQARVSRYACRSRWCARLGLNGRQAAGWGGHRLSRHVVQGLSSCAATGSAWTPLNQVVKCPHGPQHGDRWLSVTRRRAPSVSRIGTAVGNSVPCRAYWQRFHDSGLDACQRRPPTPAHFRPQVKGQLAREAPSCALTLTQGP
jgi:hypothetical protein